MVMFAWLSCLSIGAPQPQLAHIVSSSGFVPSYPAGSRLLLHLPNKGVGQTLIDMSNSLYDLSFTDNKGHEVSLSQFKGKPVLIVNTASKCGLTPQYDGLQALHEKYSGQGLIVLGFPSDQFMQELADDKSVDEFCRVNHGVTFTLSTKVKVNGAQAHPIFKFVRNKAKSGVLGDAVKWNFTKFLVAPDGHTVKRYAPTTEPQAIAADIEQMLATA